MANIKFEKYVNGCVKNLNDKVSEDLVVEYVKFIKQSGGYKDLATRVIFDVCRVAYKPWKEMKEEDYQEMNDKTLKSLYFKAFQAAFPTAWATIKELG